MDILLLFTSRTMFTSFASQEIEPQVGEELCRLFPADDDSDLIPMLKRMKKQTAHRPKKVVRNPEPEYDKFVETRHVSSHQVSSRRHHSSDYYEDRANYSHRHLRDGKSFIEGTECKSNLCLFRTIGSKPSLRPLISSRWTRQCPCSC